MSGEEVHVGFHDKESMVKDALGFAPGDPCWHLNSQGEPSAEQTKTQQVLYTYALPSAVQVDDHAWAGTLVEAVYS